MMNEDDLVLINDARSIQWNYVNRVEKELYLNNEYESIVINPLLPKSYKEVIMVISKACNHSRVALLMDEDENYVAFMIVVDEECIPFLLEDLEDIKTPTNCIYKVYYNTELANSTSEEGLLQEFIASTVIPDLNNDVESWNRFKQFK